MKDIEETLVLTEQEEQLDEMFSLFYPISDHHVNWLACGRYMQKIIKKLR